MQYHPEHFMNAFNDGIKKWKVMDGDKRIDNTCKVCDISDRLSWEIRDSQRIHIPPCRLCIIGMYNQAYLCQNIAKFLNKYYGKNNPNLSTKEKEFKSLQKSIVNMGHDLIERFEMDTYKEYVTTLIKNWKSNKGRRQDE